jgi:ribosomal peptide maturation radical SAM protein 1
MDVHFINMPFSSIRKPTLGVSLLKSALEQNDISSKIHYFNLHFAKRIGLDLYDKIAELGFANQNLIGELIFSGLAFNKHEYVTNNIFVLLEKILGHSKGSRSYYNQSSIEEIAAELLNVAKIAPAFLNDCIKQILDENPKLVGFTSTFHQNCASIALANLIKESSNVPIIFGGANCEGEMGATLLKLIPTIDFICSGEGDIAFLEFAKFYLSGNLDHNINGILTRKSSPLEINLTNPVLDMNKLPYPNFDDYFHTLNNLSLKDSFRCNLVIETSRGCWWGEKWQCTFCGLNGSTMKYRSKSVPRALEEIEYLIAKYENHDVFVVDNILDLKYINTLFPEIFRRGLKATLFYEVKANMNKSQLRSLKQGGVSWIQPGIESLSDSILNLMKKGVSALQNIQLLKWCREIGIVPTWNIISGFPNEIKSEYDRMAENIPLLVHLYPPTGMGILHLDRFSPYFYEPKSYGIINVRPGSAYSIVYPFNDEDLKKIAYHFEFDYDDLRNPYDYIHNALDEIHKWRKLWERSNKPYLKMLKFGVSTMIHDSRPCSVQNLQILSNEMAKIYDICESIHSFDTLFTKAKDFYPSITEDDLYSFLNNLLDKRLIIKDKEKYLSLAVSV